MLITCRGGFVISYKVEVMIVCFCLGLVRAILMFVGLMAWMNSVRNVCIIMNYDPPQITVIFCAQK